MDYITWDQLFGFMMVLIGLAAVIIDAYKRN